MSCDINRTDFGEHQEITLSFIRDYRSLGVLWRPDLKGSVNKHSRLEAIKALCDKYTLNLVGVKNKIRSLRSYFRRENRRCLEEGPKYVSTWFAYKHLLFLLDYDNKTKRNGYQENAQKTKLTKNKDIDPPRSESVPLTSKEDRLSNNVEHISIRRRPKKRKLKYFHRSTETKTDGGEIRKIWNTLTDVLQPERDEFLVFGEHVAAQVRKLTPKLQAIAKHRIATVIYEIELQGIDEQDPEIKGINDNELMKTK